MWYNVFMSLEELKNKILEVTKNYPVKKITLFGSRARGDNKPDSDVDLLFEFFEPYVSLIMLSGLKIDLQEKLNLNVDVIHSPIPKDSLLEIDKEIVLYAA